MSGQQDGGWGNGELTRAVQGLTTAVGKLEDKLGDFATKEWVKLTMQPSQQHQQAVRGWTRELVAPVVTALIVGALMHFAGGHA